jgi:glucokinase
MNLALAVDFGATKVEAALVDDTGTVVAGSRFREPTGRLSSSSQLEQALDSVMVAALAAVPPDQPLVGIGIGSAGPLDIQRGLVSPLNLPAWHDYPLLARVQRKVPDVSAVLRVDGYCIALAEHWLGALRGYDSVMGMIVSTGVGGGLIVKGVGLSGATGNAGHVGHIEVGGFDDECSCGGIGCLEAIASGPNAVRWANAQGWVGETGEDLARGYAAGDPIAVATIGRVGRALGQAIASATALNDLDGVAIGGGFARVTPDLFPIIRRSIADRAAFGFVTKVQVVPSALDGDAPLVGAAALIHHRVSDSSMVDASSG